MFQPSAPIKKSDDIDDKISLINHASVCIRNEEICILTDPWFSGLAFDKGWALLFENNSEDIDCLVNELTHIYISHEHPDHFSVNFFAKYSDVLREKNVKILFQRTRDNRVRDFLRDKFLLDVVIIGSNWTPLTATCRCQIITSGTIDSALILETSHTTYINLNDCDFSAFEIYKIKNSLDKIKPRVLLNQFSYAAWRSSKEWLNKAAKYKLNQLCSSAIKIEANIVIPFASFAYFCHEQNFHLNSEVNTPARVSEALDSRRLCHSFLVPWPKQYKVFNLLNEPEARLIATKKATAFWTSHYKDARIIKPANNSELFLTQLDIDFYLKRIRLANNTILMKVISFLSWKKFFGNVNIYINNTGESYQLNYQKIEKISTNQECDVAMDSDTFSFMIKQPFGMDSILVNGRFSEIKKSGFRAFLYALGFQMLNSNGYGVRLRDIFNKKLAFRLIGLGYRVFKKES